MIQRNKMLFANGAHFTFTIVTCLPWSLPHVQFDACWDQVLLFDTQGQTLQKGWDLGSEPQQLDQSIEKYTRSPWFPYLWLESASLIWLFTYDKFTASYCGATKILTLLYEHPPRTESHLLLETTYFQGPRRDRGLSPHFWTTWYLPLIFFMNVPIPEVETRVRRKRNVQLVPGASWGLGSLARSLFLLAGFLFCVPFLTYCVAIIFW